MRTLFYSVLFLIWSSSSAFEKIDWSNVRNIEEIHKLERNGWQNIDEPNNSVSISKRVFGGQAASVNQFPYMVAHLPRFRNTEGLCGGSLISTTFVLTAAHCVRLSLEIAESTLVIVGAHNIQQNENPQERFRVFPESYIIHPEFSPVRAINDIALLRLPSPITVSSYIETISLPLSPDLQDETFVGQRAFFSGWGRFSSSSLITSDVLRFALLPIVGNPTCSAFFPGLVRSENLCASGVSGGACLGDNGGPLTITRGGKPTVIGIFSLGNAMACETTWPMVFTRVTSYLDFIQDSMSPISPPEPGKDD